MSSNPFSEETIPSRPGKPAHLLSYMRLDDEGLILLDEQALRILKEVEEPIAVITVVGSYRRGKSYFANTLLGRHDGFKLGSSVDGCTKGIDIWDTPFSHEGKRVVVIDCEGINDPNQEAPWANNLFILCLAISSTLIYNINGVIGRDDIEKLFLVTNVVSKIQPPNEHQFLPNLVVLLRDFQLDSPPDFVEYFLDRISKVNDDAAKEIKKFFKNFQVYEIPPPGIGQEAMRNMNAIRTDQLDRMFVTKIKEAVTNIFKDLPPKYLGASTMTGVAFAEFLEKCVDQLNNPANTMLSIPSAYEASINYAARKADKTCIEHYNEMMNQMKFPTPWDKFEDVHSVAFEFAHQKFIQQIIGSANQIQSFQKEFCNKITASKDQFFTENSAALIKYHNEWAHKLWKENVAYGLEIENLFDKNKFADAIELFEQTYGSIAIPGQEAIQVLNEFKANQYEDAIRLLNIYDALHNEHANEMLTHQQNERQCYEILQVEGKLLAEINSVRAENEKIQKQLEEKVKTIEECILKQEQREQALEQLNNENARMLRQIEDYKQLLNNVKEENQLKMNGLQNQLNNNARKKNEILGVVKDIFSVIAPIAPLIVSCLFN
ncbi:12892_t:CDS:2 [Dentiscutata erythropus]|uniref:12892_t:CDS:1 n=1 Tax=Dentiscutata erythropus TaxID=1348616 RepID=A0A9N9E479_9GLOM|nr:12892_t:CDS:2 [Dentiscutata erythropus]